MKRTQTKEPSFLGWALKIAGASGLTGIICCVAPAVLFMFGLVSGIYAISFANFFYHEDGSAGLGAWILRGLAVGIGVVGIILYRRKQNQCSVDPKRKLRNTVLASVMIALLAISFYLSLEQLSGWFFDNYIVPAQQADYETQKAAQ